MSLAGRTILVTGASGFLGGHLLRKVQALGAQAVGLVRDAARAPSLPGLRVLEAGAPGALIEAVARLSPDAVFHTAALSVREHGPHEVPELIAANIALGTYLLEGLKQSGKESPRFVTAGSFWQYSEGEGYTPNSLYAATKQAFLDLCVYYRDLTGVRCMALVLPDVYGENDGRGRILNTLAGLPASAPAIRMSPGHQVVDFLHVDDAAAAFVHADGLLQAQGKDLPIEFVLHGPSPLPLREVVARLAAVRGAGVPVDWGALPYRAREVMQPVRGRALPGWSAEISLDEGLHRLAAR